MAPFLSFDADPYPVVVDGRIQWILDGYTTTNRYPNAQRADTADLPEGSGLRKNFNYVRNSVKAVVDAYDGTVELYIVDESDPLARTYSRRALQIARLADPLGSLAYARFTTSVYKLGTAGWSEAHEAHEEAEATFERLVYRRLL